MNVIEQEMKVRKTLKDLLQILKERDTVKKILQAKDVKHVWSYENEIINSELKKFEQSMSPFLEKGWVAFEDFPEFVNKGNILEFCVILMMTGCIDEIDVTDKYFRVQELLEEVNEEYINFAKRLNNFLVTDVFSDYSEEELLELLVI